MVMLYSAKIHQLADKSIEKAVHSGLMRTDVFIFFLFLFQQLP